MKPGIVFRNYSPASAMESLSQRILQDLAEAAPSGAAVSILVEQAEDMSFKCRIEVRSRMGGFLGRGQDVFDSVAISKAAKNLMDSLTLWKRGRFGDASGKVS